MKWESTRSLIRKVLEATRQIVAGQEKTQMDLTALTAAVQDVQAQDAALTAEIATLKTSVATEITTVEAVIAALKTKIGSGEPFTQTDLDALTTQLTGVSGNLKQAVGDTTAEQQALDAETAANTATSAPAAPVTAATVQGPLHGVSS